MFSIAATASCRARPSAPATSRIGGESDFRRVAHRSQLGSIVNSSVAGHSAMPAGFEPAFQLVLPYAGLFSYSVGQQCWLVDANKILIVRPGWDYVDGQPVEHLGHASLLLNPDQSLVEELFDPFVRGDESAKFGTASSSPDLWLMTQYFLAGEETLTGLEADEWMIRVMSVASGQPRTNLRPSTRAVRLAKEFLHAHGFERLSLSRIAEAAGVSPVYLSNEFARTEGMPLYRYQLFLRLVQSLHQLRDCDDITALALDLGFSSHSHFGATFRRTFGVSPSDYRSTLRSRRAHVAGEYVHYRQWTAGRTGVARRPGARAQ